jgi:hypothetical protein
MTEFVVGGCWQGSRDERHACRYREREDEGYACMYVYVGFLIYAGMGE